MLSLQGLLHHGSSAGRRKGSESVSLIQLDVDHNELIRRERLLEHRPQLFLARHAEAFGAVEFGELGEIWNKKLGADDAAGVVLHLIARQATARS